MIGARLLSDNLQAVVYGRVDGMPNTSIHHDDEEVHHSQIEHAITIFMTGTAKATTQKTILNC